MARALAFRVVNTHISCRDKKQYHTFVHLDHHLGVGWSSVYVLSKYHVVVKIAAVPKKHSDKAELSKGQLSNEKANKLSRITG